MIGPVNILLIIIFLIIIPFVIGLMADGLFDDSEAMALLLRPLIMGFAVMLALFQMIAVPMVLFGSRFSTLFYVYGTFIIILTAFSLFVYVKYGNKRINVGFERLRNELKKFTREDIIVSCAAIARFLGPSALILNASSSCVSHPLTLVYAAQLIIA